MISWLIRSTSKYSGQWALQSSGWVTRVHYRITYASCSHVSFVEACVGRGIMVWFNGNSSTFTALRWRVFQKKITMAKCFCHHTTRVQTLCLQACSVLHSLTSINPFLKSIERLAICSVVILGIWRNILFTFQILLRVLLWIMLFLSRGHSITKYRWLFSDHLWYFETPLLKLMQTTRSGFWVAFK